MKHVILLIPSSGRGFMPQFPLWRKGLFYSVAVTPVLQRPEFSEESHLYVVFLMLRERKRKQKAMVTKQIKEGSI